MTTFSACIPCGRMFLRLSDGTCPLCGRPMTEPSEKTPEPEDACPPVEDKQVAES